MTVTFEPPEVLETTKRFEPSVVVTGPIVTPLKVCKVPTVAKGTVRVSVANDAFPVTVNGLVGFVVPIPTHAFELMTTIFEPPDTLEKRAMFEPRVVEVGPTRIPEAIYAELQRIPLEPSVSRLSLFG